MKKVITAILTFVVVALMAFGYWDAMKHREHIGEKPFDPKETIFEHLGDAYGWEVPFNHNMRIPLPIIVVDDQNSLHCFLSSNVAHGASHDGFYIAQSGDSTPTVIASTANPFKFSASVLDAVRPGMTEGMNEFDMVLGLHVETGADCPPKLANLKDKTTRFTGCCKKEDMEKVVFDMLSK